MSLSLLSPSLSLSLLSPLMKTLFIKLYLQRPKFDKDTLKESQPHLFQAITSSKFCDHHDTCPGSLRLSVTWLLCLCLLSPDICTTQGLCSELLFTGLCSSFQPPCGKEEVKGSVKGDCCPHLIESTHWAFSQQENSRSS